MLAIKGNATEKESNVLKIYPLLSENRSYFRCIAKEKNIISAIIYKYILKFGFNLLKTFEKEKRKINAIIVTNIPVARDSANLSAKYKKVFS